MIPLVSPWIYTIPVTINWLEIQYKITDPEWMHSSRHSLFVDSLIYLITIYQSENQVMLNLWENRI